MHRNVMSITHSNVNMYKYPAMYMNTATIMDKNALIPNSSEYPIAVGQYRI